VGATDEFFSFDIANKYFINYLDSIDTSDVAMISLQGSGAYIASPRGNTEVAVIDISNPSQLVEVGVHNMTDRNGEGTAIYRQGTMVLVGTNSNTGVDEFQQLEATGNDVPSGTPAYGYNASGTVMKIIADHEDRYGFIANTWARRPLEIICLKTPSSFIPEEFVWPNPMSVDRPGRGLFYGIPYDRLYFTTTRGLYIFQPSLAAPMCP
jgi:hypothetical protein